MAYEELPLGIDESVWKDLDSKEQEIAKTLASWDLSFLEGDRLSRHGLKSTYTHGHVIVELKKFLLIKVLRSPHPMGCFSETVAACWHAFILDTMRYEEFCQRLYGKTIHHRPSNYGRGENDNTIWISIYHEWFGKFPEVWKLDINGREIPGYERAMNVEGNVASNDMDSDDGQYAM